MGGALPDDDDDDVGVCGRANASKPEGTFGAFGTEPELVPNPGLDPNADPPPDPKLLPCCILDAVMASAVAES